MKYYLITIFLCILTLSLIVFGQSSLRNFVLTFDWNYLDGVLSRSLLENEPTLNKNDIESTDFDFNYSWLNEESFIFIAHRGGDWLSTGQNTKETIKKSIDHKVKFIEVDLDFNESGEIVCLSDTDPLYSPCNLEWLSQMLKKYHFYLVLDVKFNVHNLELYSKFYERILDADILAGLHCRLIPQVYNFLHLKILNDFSYPTGPIFTTYRTNVPDKVIHEVLTKTSIKAMTVPFSSISVLKEFEKSTLSFFVHPVSQDSELSLSRSYKVKGVYTNVFLYSQAEDMAEKATDLLCQNN